MIPAASHDDRTPAAPNGPTPAGRRLNLAVACGGTGGHIFPGLAVARALAARGHTVTVWLAGKPIEQQSARDWPGPVEIVPWSGWSGRSLRDRLRALAGFVRALAHSRRTLRRLRPAALLAMGSYASVPPALAARSLGIPLLLHESNVVPGRAVALLARFASVAAIGFPETAQFLPARRTVCTGFPVRDLRPAAAPPAPPDRPPTVLIMGGSQGAQRLNELAVEALACLHAAGQAPRVIHLAGPRDEESVRRRYAAAGVSAEVHGFLHDMASAYAAATLAVSRAGAASCAELALFGLPAILVPYPHAARNHQAANARALERDGAATVMEEPALTAGLLAAAIGRLLRDQAAREAMSAAARRRAHPGGTDELARLVETTAAGQAGP